MLDAIKGPDSRDWHSLPDDGIAYRERIREAPLENALRGKRIALSQTLGLADPAPAVREAIERAAQVFTALGAMVEPADPFPQSPKPIFDALAAAAFWGLLRAQPEEAVAVMDPGLVATCRAGKRVTQEQYVEAVTARAALGQALRLFFDRFDLLLSPTMPIAAAYADPRDDELPNPTNFRTWMPYTSPFNLTRNPCCSVPCGFDGGLPIGLQVIGPLFDDLAVLKACRAYQEAAGPALPNPELISCLDRIAAPADASVEAKRWKKRA